MWPISRTPSPALRAFRARELSPVELLDALVARADAVEGTVNAFTARRTEASYAARQAADTYARLARTGVRSRPRSSGSPWPPRRSTSWPVSRWSRG